MKKFFFGLIMISSFYGFCMQVKAQQEKQNNIKSLPQKVYTAAVLPFSERGTGVKNLGTQISDLLFASLVEKSSIWLVERAELKKILNELELNASGMVNSDQALKLGQLTGAKLLITGSVFKIKKKFFIVAKVIGTETGRVVGKSVSGTTDIEKLSVQLAKKVSGLIDNNANKLMPEMRTRKDITEALKKQIGGAPKPALFIVSNERHIGQATVDPAIETELNSVCKELGFKITQKKDEAEVILQGEGFSEFASRRGNLVSVKGRVELKAVSNSGSVIAADKQTSVAVDLSELIAGKKALQDATLKIIGRLLPEIVKEKR